MLKKIYNKQEYIYRTLKVKMSKDRMADVLYAGFETDAEFTTLWNMNRGEYTRKQNVHNLANIMVHIHPEAIPLFEEISNCELETPQKVTIN